MEDNKYQQAKIYKIVCNKTGEVYIGSTIEKYLCDRLGNHKAQKDCVSRNIINRGDYKIELIKDYPCNSLYELEEEEKKYILENDCINVKIPHRTKKEWYEDNKKKILERVKKYGEEKVTCECGAIVRKDGLLKHKKRLSHIKLMECLIID